MSWLHQVPVTIIMIKHTVGKMQSIGVYKPLVVDGPARNYVSKKSPVLSILALPARRKSKGETCDQKQKENHRHNDHQHLDEG